MKAILILEGPGWGAGNSTSLYFALGGKGVVRHHKRGDVVTVDCPPGSEEEKEWQRRIDADMCRPVTGVGAKPAA